MTDEEVAALPAEFRRTIAQARTENNLVLVTADALEAFLDMHDVVCEAATQTEAELDALRTAIRDALDELALMGTDGVVTYGPASVRVLARVLGDKP